MVSSKRKERRFIREAVCFRDEGGNLDQLVSIDDEDESGGFSIEDAPVDGATRLLYACSRYSWCSAIKSLLELGADVNLGQPSEGRTPLHVAALSGCSDAVLLLLDAGARVNERTGCGRTALHFVAAVHSRKICKLLLSRGASLDARNHRGENPEAQARAFRNPPAAAFLAAVRAAGGWLPYLNAPRKELLALRQRLPALRDRGRAAPSSSVRAHERLFLKTPDDVFSHVLSFWRSDRDD